MSESKPIAVLDIKEVKKRTSLSKSSIYREIAADRFPKQKRLTANRVGWPEAEIERYLANPMNYRPIEQQAVA